MIKPVLLRRRALEDVESAIDHYVVEGGADVASRFIDALEGALAHLGRHPLTGSLRYSYELEIPELRSWPVLRYPYSVFYVVSTERVDVWRVLHTHRDIPGSFATA